MALLLEHGIVPHELSWGTGTARTPEKLLQEVNKGECQLVSIEVNGQRCLLRRTHIALVDVYIDLRNGQRLALVETAHVRNLDSFASPKSFVNRLLDTTLTEKGENGEDALMTAIRALFEELRFAGFDPSLDSLEQFMRDHPHVFTEEDRAQLRPISIGEMFEAPVGEEMLPKVDAESLLAQYCSLTGSPPWRPQQFKYTRSYPSPSYPGTLTESKSHWLVYLMINRHQFAIGYYDRDGNKLTTYDWRDTSRVSRR
ncbi:MAG: hypothetical protein V4681_01955 [Patescibacteria group bacterium]